MLPPPLRSPSPPVDGAPARIVAPAACAAWGPHAAMLAEVVAEQMRRWPLTPATAALVYDGALLCVREGVLLPRDMAGSTAARAVATGCALGPDLRPAHVIGGTSAAWVWSGGRPPTPVWVLAAERPRPVAGVRVQEPRRIGTADVELVGGCPVTSPERTAADLLRFAGDADAAHWVAALVESGQLDPRRVEGALAEYAGHPHSALARERWSAQREELLGPMRASAVGASQPGSPRHSSGTSGAQGCQARASDFAGASMRRPSAVTR